ncbi:MAG: amidohydrolase family protein [Actinomycetota bacterium]|nr:amidohydrolase family protein [Actinomycetota bacterium]|tara:strand:- start:5085 stop:6407 length:1323 start_codon:yes stop_codon:yes gene_type:complete
MPEEILITNGMLVDGNGAAPVSGTSLWVRDGEIAGIGNQDNFKVSTDAVVIDATGKTVMPGLIDSHLHSTFDDVQSNDELFFHRDSVMSALVTTQNLVKILRSGVTSFVDPDTAHGIGPAIRNAIEAGVIQGPRMKTGVQALLTAVGGTAGHLIPDQGTVGYAQIVNSVDEVIMWTRRHIKYGADWIKLHATGSLSGRPGELMVWSREEVRAACNAAKDLGVPVMAHCRNPESVKICAEEGVSLILHASFMDDEGLEAVVENDVAICPTFTFLANLADFGSKVGASPGMEDIFRGEIEQTAKMIRKAYDAGIRLVSGSESGFALTPYGHWHARELEIFVEVLGLSEVEAITTATKNGAWTMRMEDHLGTLEEGKLADVIIIDGDVTSDITMLNDKSRLNEVISRGSRVDLSGPWPEHGSIPGWKVGNWAAEILTWEKAYE